MLGCAMPLVVFCKNNTKDILLAGSILQIEPE
jgi:hypothetical protein